MISKKHASTKITKLNSNSTSWAEYNLPQRESTGVLQGAENELLLSNWLWTIFFAIAQRGIQTSTCNLWFHLHCSSTIWLKVVYPQGVYIAPLMNSWSFLKRETLLLPHHSVPTQYRLTGLKWNQYPVRLQHNCTAMPYHLNFKSERISQVTIFII